MPTIQLSNSASGLGASISQATPRTADGGATREVTIPAGKAGTLSTRTDNETGTLTLGSGHGITTAQVIDLYWSGGARYGITVGTVSGTSVPIGADNSGTGSNLPAQATAIVAAPRVSIEAPIEGANLKLLVAQIAFANASQGANGKVGYIDGSAAVIVNVDHEPNVPKVYDIIGNGDAANPIDGETLASVSVSHGSSSQAATFKMMWLEDATP